MKELSALSIQKTFGHYIIRWKIKKFLLATCQESFVVRSPKFKFFVPDSNWKMELETTSDDDDSVLFHFERLDGGPDVLWVNWKVSATDGGVKSHGPMYECQCLFQRNYRCTVDLQSVENVIDLLPIDKMDLMITCQVIVKHETTAKTSSETVADGLISLSRDFQRLFSKGKYYDIVIRIGEKKIRAHKSILVQRNHVWGKLISTFEPSKIISLNGLDAEAIELIVSYLYTGNLRYVLDNPSLALCDCIQFFDVKELKSIFKPKEIDFISKISSRHVTFQWLLPKFVQKRKKCVRSKIIRRPDLDSTWRLYIYPFGRDDFPRTLTLCVETVTSTGFQAVCVEFSLLNKFNKIINKTTVRGLAVSGEVIGVDNFCRRNDVLREALNRGNLRAMFKVWFSKCKQLSSISSQNFDNRTEVYTQPHYMALSEAMKGMMLGSPLGKDVILEAKGVKVLAHKCILAARSKTFSKMLCQCKDRVEVDAEGDIFKVLIDYIYSGVLGHRDVSFLSHLLKVADIFCISALKEDCNTRLQSCFKNTTPSVEE